MKEKLPLLWNEKKSKRNWGVKLLLGVFVTCFVEKELRIGGIYIGLLDQAASLENRVIKSLST